MSLLNRIPSFQKAGLRPLLACEITSAGVVAARPGPPGREIVSAFAPLRSGSFLPGLKTPIFADSAAVSSAIRQALEEVALRDTKVTLIIPDVSVRVLLLDFDTLPTRTADIPPIIRFRLRKLVPFEVENTPISYQLMPAREGLVRLLVVAAPAAVLAEYEAVVRDAGYDPGVVLPSTLAALGVIQDQEPSLLVNRSGGWVTTAITRQNELLLHRTLELFQPELAGMEMAGAEGGPLIEGESALEELRQSVSVAIAYFEDTLSAPPRQILCCGMRGAEDLSRLLGDSNLAARDLVTTPASGNTTRMPRGILAGVAGALAG